MPRRRAEALRAGAVHPPAATSAESRLRARRQAAFRPDVREAASPRRRASALLSGPGLRPAPVTPQPAERRDASNQAPVLRTARVWWSGPEASPGELPARLALSSEPASAVRQEPLKAAWLREAGVSAGPPDAPVLPRAAEVSASVRAAAGLLPEAAVLVRAAAELLPEAAVSVHVAAEPLPEAAPVPWARQAAAEVPDGSRAAASVVTARLPAVVRRADAGPRPEAASVPWVQQAAVSPGARRAAVPSALP